MGRNTEELARKYADILAEDLKTSARIQMVFEDWLMEKNSKRIVAILEEAKEKNKGSYRAHEETVDKLTIALREILTVEGLINDIQRSLLNDIYDRVAVYMELSEMSREEFRDATNLAIAYAMRPYAKEMLDAILGEK